MRSRLTTVKTLRPALVLHGTSSRGPDDVAPRESVSGVRDLLGDEPVLARVDTERPDEPRVLPRPPSSPRSPSTPSAPYVVLPQDPPGLLRSLYPPPSVLRLTPNPHTPTRDPHPSLGSAPG